MVFFNRLAREMGAACGPRGGCRGGAKRQRGALRQRRAQRGTKAGAQHTRGVRGGLSVLVNQSHVHLIARGKVLEQK